MTVTARPLTLGPTGLGTSALRIGARRPKESVPELYCPSPVRDDKVLGKEVNDRLIDWADEVGIYSGRLEMLQQADFGRLIMLTHPDTDDPDRLLAAAKCATAEWAVDDHYCDDEEGGSVTALLGSRLGVGYAAVDPAQLPNRYAPRLERAMRDDPVRIALRSSVEHLSQYASPAQVARLRHELAVLFVAFGAEASWRTTGRFPPVYEYLVNRQQNSFLPCMALIDPVGGYEVPPHEYAHPRVRGAVRKAATASAIVNDLYSMTRESSRSGVDFNLPTVIAAEEHQSLHDAVRDSVEIHDELVRTFEIEATGLSLDGSPALKRFLSGVWAWLGGNLEWHKGSERYQSNSI